MKFFVLAFATLLVSTVNAVDCDPTAIQVIISSPNASACVTEANFTATTLMTPSEAQLARMCASDACMSLLVEARTAAPSECTIGGSFALYADLITPLTKVCNGDSTQNSTQKDPDTTTAPTSAAPTPVAPTPVAPTPAPLSSKTSTSDASTTAASVVAISIALAATFF